MNINEEYEYRWKVAYLFKRNGMAPLNWGALNKETLEIFYKDQLARYVDANYLKLAKREMNSAWRQHLKRRRDEEKGIKQHTFTLSNDTMKELEKLALLKNIGLNEALGYIIRETYHSLPIPLQKTPRKSQSNKRPSGHRPSNAK